MGEPFSTSDSYTHYQTTTSQSYAYLNSTYGAPMNSMDSFPPMSAPYDFTLDHASGVKYPHSPAATDAEQFMPRLTASSESGQSTSSSAMGSPQLAAQFLQHEPWNPLISSQSLGMHHDMSSDIFTREPFYTSSMEQESAMATKIPGFVDPSNLGAFGSPLPFAYNDPTSMTSPRLFEQPPSPAPSHGSLRSQTGRVPRPSPHQSPYLSTQQYHPYPRVRRNSTTSLHSQRSHNSHRSGSYELSEEDKEKGICPIPDCGKVFKDLKAHMLTHQAERPEKYPIVTCEYHHKGFARKYDKNRHTLTHYKGTMVCGFCPGSGTAAEKSFNRADVFKRHLTSVHNVEQTAPNSRRKSPSSASKKQTTSATCAGTCSTCGVTFANPQEFYEHLDDCVLRVVQQIDPAEDINQKNLSSIAEDSQVIETLENHGLPADFSAPTSYDDEEEMDDEDAEGDDDR